MKDTGILVVDIQGDFTKLKNGSLAVEGTDAAYMKWVEAAVLELKENGYQLFATQDWHPADHISFFTNTPGKQMFDTIMVDGRTQVLWPPHCVQDTENAELLLNPDIFTAAVKKGTHPRYDSYSGFQDDGGVNTGLDDLLKSHGIENLIIFGLATDYCVKATAVDALANGYKVVVIQDLCRGVAPDSTRDALDEMKSKGVVILPEFKPSSFKNGTY